MRKILAIILTVTMLAALCAFSSSAVKSFDDKYTFDFESMDADYNLITPYKDGNTFRNIWTPNDVLGTGASVKLDGTNKYGQFNGFSQIPCDYIITEPYVFGADMMGTQGDGSWKGVFVRSSAKDFKPTGNQASTPWFEWDGSTKDAGYTGTTGIFIVPKIIDGKNTLVLGVKTLDKKDDLHWIENIVYKAAPDGVDLNGFVTFEFVDDNKSEVKINVNGKLFASVKYSNLGNYDTFTEKYYKTAKIYDAAGKEVASTDAALICESSEIVFFTRNATVNIDNIYFKAYTPAAPIVNPGTSDAAVVVIALVAAIALASAVVCKKVRA